MAIESPNLLPVKLSVWSWIWLISLEDIVALLDSRYNHPHLDERQFITITKSFIYFVAAGLCEIGGGYFIWLWLREHRSPWYALGGAMLLILYGVVPTLQAANFGRVYAAYGRVFIVLSILWGWRIDKVIPDKFDIIGCAIALAGVVIIMYWPRN